MKDPESSLCRNLDYSEFYSPFPIVFSDILSQLLLWQNLPIFYSQKSSQFHFISHLDHSNSASSLSTEPVQVSHQSLRNSCFIMFLRTIQSNCLQACLRVLYDSISLFILGPFEDPASSS
ncbi:hypothetical protein AVEN_174366-1 [Araneus ventricosus]|uniref:Uncharacterized protein n=1 Tax=Araneus ventricosus TaxID=182803 RepID=A0A4Y2F6I9_ARAVE|nr:hypothetical protein AVEN_174366-1 [Araneus ventricosus]